MYGNNSKIVVAGGAYEGNTAGAEGGMAYVIQSHLNVTTGAEIFLGKAPRGGAVYARDRSIVDVRVGVPGVQPCKCTWRCGIRTHVFCDKIVGEHSPPPQFSLG